MDHNQSAKLLSSVINHKSHKKANSPNVFEIHHEPAMAKALDLISPLYENNQIALHAKGDSIPKAITVANIITGNLLKGKSEIYQVNVDSDPIERMGSFESTIKIILKISSH